MHAALQQAKLAAESDEVPVGCVITLDDQLVSFGHNKCITKNSVTRHAEIEAIEAASKVLGNYRILETSMYVTLEPCHMCASAIVNARIKNLFFGAYEPKTGAIVSVDNFLDQNYLNHRVLYSGGHLAEESTSMLQNFFKSRR